MQIISIKKKKKRKKIQLPTQSIDLTKIKAAATREKGNQNAMERSVSYSHAQRLKKMTCE